MKSKNITEHTESEFLYLVKKIIDNEGSESEQDKMLEDFISIAAHLAGSDLIYYPEGRNDGSPEKVVDEVKEWRLANGLPGFKAG